MVRLEDITRRVSLMDILAIVAVDGSAATPRYIRQPFQREPDFGVTSVNYKMDELLAKAEEPR